MKEALHFLSDSLLVSNFRDLLFSEREALVRQLEFLAELDRRKLTFEYPSLWAYLTSECGMADWDAEQKIRAARLLARFPEIAALLEAGKLNLSLLELAGRVASRERLSDEELREILDSISGLSIRRARREMAARFPSSAQELRDRVIPISEELTEVRFVAGSDLLEKLEEIKGLLAHSHPGIGMAELIDLLASEYRLRHHPEEKARRSKAVRSPVTSEVVALEAAPRLNSRKETRALNGPEAVSASELEVVPPRIREAAIQTRTPGRILVHDLLRSQGKYCCSYVDPITKQKCTSTFALEIDHIIPWSKGGATELRNLRLLCRGHHRRVSFTEFGSSAKYRS